MTQGYNERTAAKGKFPVANVFVIPSISKPSAALVQLYVIASRADLLKVPSFDAVKHVGDDVDGKPQTTAKKRWGVIRGSLAKNTKPAAPVFKVVKFAKPKEKVTSISDLFSLGRRDSKGTSRGGGGPSAVQNVKRASFSRRGSQAGGGSAGRVVNEVCNNLGNCTCSKCILERASL